MSSYLTEAEEISRRYELDERRHHHATPTQPAPRRRTRTRMAAALRHAAERLDQ